MSAAQSIAEIVYPESDGKPMAETELHMEWMNDIRNRLKYRYRQQQVYVGCNMFVYYIEGDPQKSVAPDVFVVKDCDSGMRRTFKTWEEQRTPDVVIEVTSESTRREDENFKPETYARIGVKELFLYDPTGDYLNPTLQGFRFAQGRTTRIRPDASGALECRELGIRLRLEKGALRLSDARTGKRLLTETEVQRSRAKAERAARKSADARAKAADAHAKAADAHAKAADARADAERAAREAAEEEVGKLREQLKRRRGNGN
jgi:Uma2 family endonuclease